MVVSVELDVGITVVFANVVFRLFPFLFLSGYFFFSCFFPVPFLSHNVASLHHTAEDQ